MQLLRDMVEGSRRREEVPTRAVGESDKLKLSKLAEADDVEAYLTMFERMMVVYEVDRTRWAFKLAPQLTGKAQQAYAALSADEAGDYDRLKMAILKRYNINEETYRQRFRSATRKGDESYRELKARLQDMAKKWMKGCTTAEEVVDLMVTEQLVNTLAPDVRVWVRERKPKNSEEASQLADDYLQARKKLQGEHEQREVDGASCNEEVKREGRHPTPEVRRCSKCGMLGHSASDCRRGTRANGQHHPQAHLQEREVRCFNCGRSGHKAMRCPGNALFCQREQEEVHSSFF